MAILHAATISPTKAEAISQWLPEQPWSLGRDDPVTIVGSFRFDDPQGSVGLEVHLVRQGDVLLQVPLTYRDAPLDGADEHLVTMMEHSVLGTRWVYDGLADPVFTRVLAAVTMTGSGQAVGLVELDGRWLVVPASVRIVGGGLGERVPVDGFAVESDEGAWAVLRNDQFALQFARRPVAGDRPPIGLTATWPGQDAPVVLAAVTRTT